jgi:hypothetical protein
MPVTYTIDVQGKVIRTICASPLTFAEVLDHFRELREDPAFSGTLDVLLNVDGVDALPERAQLGTVSAELGAVVKKAKFGSCAIFASRDAMFGMMRIFEVFAAPYFRNIRVFRGPAEAEQWLVSERRAGEAVFRSDSGASRA